MTSVKHKEEINKNIFSNKKPELNNKFYTYGYNNGQKQCSDEIDDDKGANRLVEVDTKLKASI